MWDWSAILELLFLDWLVLGAGAVFFLPLERRDRFPLRLTLCLAGGSLAALLFSLFQAWAAPPLPLDIALDLLGMALLFALIAGACRLCTRCDFSGCIYCAVWAMVSQQLIHELWLTVRALLNLPAPHWWQMGLWFLLAYTALFFTVARWLPEKGRYHAGPRQMSLAILMVALSAVLYELSFVFGATAVGSGPSLPQLIVTLVQAYCVTVLYLQSVLFQKSAMRQELVTLNLLWQQSKAQYSLAKENIDLINRKCHDLKHQMHALRTMAGSEERGQYVSELEASLQIYDSIVKTGNEALDTILTEKSLYCEANQILINCVADGSGLGFINPIDLYAIFGNALSNAIESVQDMEDPARRVIDVLVYVKQQFLSISITNPLERGKLQFEDGLPLTTKERNGYHGFGLKSIRHTAEKYGGFVTVETKDGCFSLRILFPLPG